MGTKDVQAALKAWPGSLRSLAAAVDLAPSALFRMRTGERGTPASVLRGLAEVLDARAAEMRRVARHLRRAAR